MDFWSLKPENVETLQGGDGGAFRDFVNRIIRGHAAINGIPPSAISTDSTNAQDGGVDCEVKLGNPHDPSGRLTDKTCWQYKAMEHKSISDAALRKEVNKPYASKLIRDGYAYRLCIADSLVPEKKAGWEQILSAEIKKINPNAPEPHVLTSSCLAA